MEGGGRRRRPKSEVSLADGNSQRRKGLAGTTTLSSTLDISEAASEYVRPEEREPRSSCMLRTTSSPHDRIANLPPTSRPTLPFLATLGTRGDIKRQSVSVGSIGSIAQRNPHGLLDRSMSFISVLVSWTRNTHPAPDKAA